MLVTHQIEPLGLLCTNLGTKTFFGKFEPKKGSGGGDASEKSRFFTHFARFAQGMQNLIFAHLLY